MIKRLHHTSIIVSSEAGIEFYKKLGFTEEIRFDRIYDQIVWLSGYGEQLEIYIDATHPPRPTNPETLGLRHLAFETSDVETEWQRLGELSPEPIKINPDGKKFFFLKDPDSVILGTSDLNPCATRLAAISNYLRNPNKLMAA